MQKPTIRTQNMAALALRCLAVGTLLSLSVGCATKPVMRPCEVVRIADAAARKAGYDLRLFDRSPPRHNFVHKDDEWYVSYEGKPDRNGMTTTGNHFAVSVQDKTREVHVAYGR